MSKVKQQATQLYLLFATSSQDGNESNLDSHHLVRPTSSNQHYNRQQPSSPFNISVLHGDIPYLSLAA